MHAIQLIWIAGADHLKYGRSLLSLNVKWSNSSLFPQIVCVEHVMTGAHLQFSRSTLTNHKNGSEINSFLLPSFVQVFGDKIVSVYVLFLNQKTNSNHNNSIFLLSKISFDWFYYLISGMEKLCLEFSKECHCLSESNLPAHCLRINNIESKITLPILRCMQIRLVNMACIFT